jgi:hypothetical protein
MLSILESIKIFISRDNVREYRGTSVKQIIVTTIEYISVDSRSLYSLII